MVKASVTYLRKEMRVLFVKIDVVAERPHCVRGGNEEEEHNLKHRYHGVDYLFTSGVSPRAESGKSDYGCRRSNGLAGKLAVGRPSGITRGLSVM